MRSVCGVPKMLMGLGRSTGGNSAASCDPTSSESVSATQAKEAQLARTVRTRRGEILEIIGQRHCKLRARANELKCGISEDAASAHRQIRRLQPTLVAGSAILLQSKDSRRAQREPRIGHQGTVS